MRHRPTVFIFALLAFGAFGSAAFAQTAGDFFNGDVLHEIRIYIAPADYATFLQTNFTCPAQEDAALAGQILSPVPRLTCWFPIEFHWKFNGRDITTPQVALGGPRDFGLGHSDPPLGREMRGRCRTVPVGPHTNVHAVGGDGVLRAGADHR